ncbi:hypothetical protein SPRG_03331 [Saprolegnia parasitica CBS 223.65]|uniref:U-box domain-containing protein n=1 Tax=Saprolegnia parasitica (strain CBS 223.65) TaxID=695850 RepID=A0A067CNN4_SAPPC|nr:hypothetical protein SPRG_03331 [Saprolegnia parasitica CBS 223.65]KDO32113.1 hypothetical protein SPRG_03331 [Saprolegnia parasitica CBS 223.65]|eukprot:XP_012197298.1 hypothetical protein SPRG_03331 [Saprolegnia parasitica CBS 223.65]
MTRHLDSFVCPITQDVMVDPVVTVDGHSYERSAIAEWIRTSRETAPGGQVTSPATNLPLRSLQLIPNLALKRSIEEYRNERSSSRGASPVARAVSAVAVAPPLRRTEALPEVGFFVYRANVALAVYSRPSFGPPVRSWSNGNAVTLPAGELVVVTKRVYGTASNHIFLLLADSNESDLSNRYICEQQEHAPYTAVAVRATTTPELKTYAATEASLFFCRPATSHRCLFTRSDMLAVNELVASDLRVQDPVTHDVFIRLENCGAWLPLRCLRPRRAITTRTIIKVSTPTNVYRNIYTWPHSTVLATLPANHLVATICHVTRNNGALFARISYDDVIGWCCLEQSDILYRCPPRVAEHAPGRSIPVAILQGNYYLLALNEVQEDGSTSQRFVCNVPSSMDRQIDNCMAKGRHVTHAAIGPNAEWYLSGTKPDGSGAHCWASKNVSEEFLEQMAINCRVAYGRYDAFALLDDDDGRVASSGLPYDMEEAFDNARKIHTFGFDEDNGFFLKHADGVDTNNIAHWFEDDILAAKPPRGYGPLVSASYWEGSYVAIYEHWFTTSNDVPASVTNALKAFYQRHTKMRNDRRRLIQRYQELE